MSLGKVKEVRCCAYCGVDVQIYHKKRLKAKHTFCSTTCAGKFIKSKSELNTRCDNCGIMFHLKPCHKNRYKTHCCSKECLIEFKSKNMTGEGNHQYGLKGRLNPTWKSDERITEYGYRVIRCLHHPFRTKYDFVFEHRLVAEKYLLDEFNSIEVDGKLYLKPELEVHHIDEDKLNNNPNNLLILTKSEHMRLHSLKRNIERDSETGRFIATQQ